MSFHFLTSYIIFLSFLLLFSTNITADSIDYGDERSTVSWAIDVFTNDRLEAPKIGSIYEKYLPRLYELVREKKRIMNNGDTSEPSLDWVFLRKYSAGGERHMLRLILFNHFDFPVDLYVIDLDSPVLKYDLIVEDLPEEYEFDGYSTESYIVKDKSGEVVHEFDVYPSEEDEDEVEIHTGPQEWLDEKDRLDKEEDSNKDFDGESDEEFDGEFDEELDFNQDDENLDEEDNFLDDENEDNVDYEDENLQETFEEGNFFEGEQKAQESGEESPGVEAEL